MPTGFDGFDASIALRRACQDIGLNASQCQKLEGYITQICGSTRRTTKTGKAKRARSAWQQCIASRRKGKPFDPQAIKALAKEYRAGTCPP